MEMGILQRVVTGRRQKLWKTACLLLQVAGLEEGKALAQPLYPARTASLVPMLELPLPTALSGWGKARGAKKLGKFNSKEEKTYILWGWDKRKWSFLPFGVNSAQHQSCCPAWHRETPLRGSGHRDDRVPHTQVLQTSLSVLVLHQTERGKSVGQKTFFFWLTEIYLKLKQKVDVLPIFPRWPVEIQFRLGHSFRPITLDCSILILSFRVF